MHLKRKHCIKHLIQVPVHILCVWIHRAGIRWKTDPSTLPYRVVLIWPQKYGLYFCSYPLITSQLSWITKGTRWVILTDSVTNVSLPSKPAPLEISPLSILSHTEDNVPYFPRNPGSTNRTILVSHISKPFLNSGQANDCGSLGTQILWEALKLNNIQILIF